MDQPQQLSPLDLTLSEIKPRVNGFELLNNLRSTAWTCASINAATCASNPPKLYVTTRKSQPNPKCVTQEIEAKTARRLRDLLQVKLSTQLQEVVIHPIIRLLDTVNPYMNAFDLWELTTLYQETIGSAFWLLEFDFLDRPYQIWPLASQYVSIYPGANQFEYLYRGNRYTQKEIIHFRYPDPASPYGFGLSPLRAAVKEATMSSEYADLKIARFKNRAAPDVVISPKEAIGEDEKQRLENQWNQKFRQGGNGRAFVSESDMTVEVLNSQMGDLALLAEKGKNSEDIVNAFHVPLSLLSTNTNLANLQASESQHSRLAIRPRLIRRDEKLNEQLIPLYDTSGRLQLCSDDPAPGGEEDWRTTEQAAKYGWMTINELRDQEGLPPVTWGDKPCQTIPQGATP